MNTLQRLHAEQGQSPWIDFIDRDLIASGRLAALVGDGIRGLTSNPTIFAKAGAPAAPAATPPPLDRPRQRGRRRSRPNLLVKIPATPAGLPAIEAAIAE